MSVHRLLLLFVICLLVINHATQIQAKSHDIRPIVVKKNHKETLSTYVPDKSEINKLDKPKLTKRSPTDPASGSGWRFDGKTLTVNGSVNANTFKRDWNTVKYGSSLGNGLFEVTITNVINPQKVVFTNNARINTTDWDLMFANFTNLTEIVGFDRFAKSMYPTSLGYMFYKCSSLDNLDVSNFRTQNVTSMISTFEGCSKISNLDVSKFDTSKVTNMNHMFYSCGKINNLDVSMFNTSKVTSMSSMFNHCSNITSLDVSKFNTSNVTSMDSMFSSCSSLTSLDLSNFNTSNVTSMSSMFSSCSSLTSLDLSNFNTSKVTSMSSMFNHCSSLTSLDVNKFNTSNVTSMSSMFSSCSSLTSLDLSNFNTSKVTRSMSSMFNHCSNIISLDLSNFNTSKITNMDFMFRDCSSLTSLNVSNFNTSKVTNMKLMFRGCSSLTSLDLSNFNTSKITQMESMFSGCSSLTSLDLSSFNTSEITHMNFMFRDCSSLTSLDLSSFNTSKTTDMSRMFYNCSSLTSLDLSNFNTSKITNMSQMFYNCSGLTSLNLSNLNTGNVEYMLSMFSGCSSLTSLDLSSFNTSNVRDMLSMFSGCSSLIYLDLSSFNTSNVRYMDSMFSGCSSLKNLDISKFNTIWIYSIKRMFYGCSNLESLDISNFVTSNTRPNMNDMLNTGTPEKSKLYKLTLGRNTVLTDNVGIPEVGTKLQYPIVHPHKGLRTTGSWQVYRSDDTDQWTASGDILKSKDIVNRHKTVNTTSQTYVWQAKNYYKMNKTFKTLNASNTVPVGNNTVQTTYNLIDGAAFDKFKLSPIGTNSNNVQMKNGATISITYGTTKTAEIPFNYNQIYTGTDFGIVGKIPANSLITINQPVKIVFNYAGVENNQLSLAADELLTQDIGESTWQKIAKTTAATHKMALSNLVLTVPSQIDFGKFYSIQGVIHPKTINGDLSLYNPESFAQNVVLTHRVTSSTPLIEQNLKYHHPEHSNGKFFDQLIHPNKKVMIPTKHTGAGGVVLDFTTNNMLPAGQHNAEIEWSVTNSV